MMTLVYHFHTLISKKKGSIISRRHSVEWDCVIAVVAIEEAFKGWSASPY